MTKNKYYLLQYQNEPSSLVHPWEFSDSILTRDPSTKASGWQEKLEPEIGVEPTTYALRMRFCHSEQSEESQRFIFNFKP